MASHCTPKSIIIRWSACLPSGRHYLGNVKYGVPACGRQAKAYFCKHNNELLYVKLTSFNELFLINPYLEINIVDI